MIYFDNASSTIPSKECLDIFYEASLKNYANPNSIHKLGVENFGNINRVRERILNCLKLDSSYEVIFTSGATESNNLAIKGYVLKNKNRGNKIITTKIEHESVLNVFKSLEKAGFNVVYLNILPDGSLDLGELKREIDKNTILVSVMPVNNEVGNVLNIKEVKEIVSQFPKCVLHCDCAQTLGKYKFDYKLCDLFTISGHKINGIKGVGALIKKRKVNIECLLDGGGQENNLRSGTLDYPSILSFAYTIEDTQRNFDKNYKNIEVLRGFLTKELEKIEEVKLHTYELSTPYIVNLSLKTKKASVVVEALSNKEIYVSSVSACNSKNEEPSHVLLALGESEDSARNAIRISLGKANTIEECAIFIDFFKEIISTLRSR